MMKIAGRKKCLRRKVEDIGQYSATGMLYFGAPLYLVHQLAAVGEVIVGPVVLRDAGCRYIVGVIAPGVSSGHIALCEQQRDSY